jgi:hypothetical protein
LKFLTKDINLFAFIEAAEISATNTEGSTTISIITIITLLIALKLIFDKLYSQEDQGIVSDDEDLKNNESGRDRF